MSSSAQFLSPSEAAKRLGVSAKALRIYEPHYAYPGMGGHINIGIDGPWDARRIHGTVPVERDGVRVAALVACNPAGKFALTLTVSETTGQWISLGFSSLNTPATNANFVAASAGGIATIIRREIGDWDLDMFLGPANMGAIDGPELGGAAKLEALGVPCHALIAFDGH